MGGAVRSVTKAVQNVADIPGDAVRAVTGGGGSRSPEPSSSATFAGVPIDTAINLAKEEMARTHPVFGPQIPITKEATTGFPQDAIQDKNFLPGIKQNPYYDDFVNSQFYDPNAAGASVMGEIVMPDGSRYSTGNGAIQSQFQDFLTNRLSGPGQDQFNQLQDQFNTIQDQYSGLQGQYGNLESELGLVRDQYGNLRDQYGNLTDQFGNLQQDYSGLQTQFGDLQNRFQTTDQVRQQLANRQALNLAQDQGMGPMGGPTVAPSPYQIPGGNPVSYAQAVPSQPMGTPVAGGASDFLYKSLLQQTPVTTPTNPLDLGIGSLT